MDPTEAQSNRTVPIPPQKGRTWFPILLGVLSGMVALMLFAEHEPAVFCRVTAWMLGETPPVKVIEPRSVHFALFMLTLAAVGGAVGVLFSRWHKRTALLFLLATLLVIAVFQFLGARLENVWH